MDTKHKILAIILSLAVCFGCCAFAYGDVDMDGVLTAADAAVTLQYVLDSDYPFTAEQKRLAAVTDGTSLTAADAAAILQKVLDSDYTLPVESQTETTTENLYTASAADMAGESDFISAFESGSYEGGDYIYVSAGAENGSGSEKLPYGTISEAVENAKPGSTIIVHSGEYKENIYIENSGKPNEYITIKNADGETPVIAGTNKNDVPMIDFGGSEYICIDGIELCNYTAEWCYGMYMGGGENHIIIRNCTIHDISCSNPGNPDSSGANGILLFGESTEPISNVIIDGCTIYNLTTGWCEALSVAANCEYINVTNNKVHDCTNIGIDFYGNNADGYCPVESLNQPRYCTAAGNEVYGCFCEYADCCGIYADGARDIKITKNISHDNQGGIEVGSEERNEDYPVKNIEVSNNYVYGNTVNGLVVGGWSDDSEAEDFSGVMYDTVIENNTVKGGSSTLLNIAMCSGLTVRNNTFERLSDGYFVTSDVNPDTVHNVTFENNTYKSTLSADEAKFSMFGRDVMGFDNWKNVSRETGRCF